MRLTLERVYLGKQYTIGRLYAAGERLCDTMEPTDRYLYEHSPLMTIRAAKELGPTAIPSGGYALILSVRSPRLGGRSQYAFCNGCPPRLLDVPGYDGVLIHIGNYPEDTTGCILVGDNLVKGQLLRSTQAFHTLYERLQQAAGRGEDLAIDIRRAKMLATNEPVR